MGAAHAHGALARAHARLSDHCEGCHEEPLHAPSAQWPQLHLPSPSVDHEPSCLSASHSEMCVQLKKEGRCIGG